MCVIHFNKVYITQQITITSMNMMNIILNIHDKYIYTVFWSRDYCDMGWSTPSGLSIQPHVTVAASECFTGCQWWAVIYAGPPVPLDRTPFMSLLLSGCSAPCRQGTTGWGAYGSDYGSAYNVINVHWCYVLGSAFLASHSTVYASYQQWVSN